MATAGKVSIPWPEATNSNVSLHAGHHLPRCSGVGGQATAGHRGDYCSTS